jgi:Protein of unknown function (DUF2924)
VSGLTEGIDSRMFKLLSGILSKNGDRKDRSLVRGRSARHPWSLVRMLGRYDAATTTVDNVRHWAAADGLSASAANSPEVRRTLRNRSRYEIANNSYARGISLTLANDCIGTGPRLQMLTAETAADFAGILYTDAPAGGEADAAEPFEPIELEKRSLLTMPGGWSSSRLSHRKSRPRHQATQRCSAKRRPTMSPDTKVKLAELSELSIGQLAAKYEKLFGEKCRSRNRRYVYRRVAWKMQADDEGGLSERAILRATVIAGESLLRVLQEALRRLATSS